MRLTHRFLAFPRARRGRTHHFLAVVHSSRRRSQLGPSFTARFCSQCGGTTYDRRSSDVRQVTWRTSDESSGSHLRSRSPANANEPAERTSERPCTPVYDVIRCRFLGTYSGPQSCRHRFLAPNLKNLGHGFLMLRFLNAHDQLYGSRTQIAHNENNKS